MSWWKNQGLNFKVTLGIVTTLVIVLGFSFFGISQYIRARLWQSEIEKTENINAIAKTLLQDAMLTGRKDTIDTALNKLGTNVGNQKLDSIAVYDDQYLLTAFASGFPGGMTIKKEEMPTSIKDPSCWGCHQYPPAERPTHLIVTVAGNQVIRNSVPLYNEPRCQTCHGTGAKVLGDIMVDYSQTQFIESYNTISLGLFAGMLLAVGLVILVLYQVLRRIVLKPVAQVVKMADTMAHGHLDQQIEVQSGDEIGTLATSFNSMTSQLNNLFSTLEQRVAERTAELATTSQQNEKRAHDLQTISEISRTVSSEQGMEKVLPLITNVISDRFGFYHVGIFLVDEATNYAVLRAANSEGGQKMLAKGHRLEVGQVGIVGRVAATGMPRIALNVGEDATYFKNPDLPKTLSEIALPLKISGKIIGVLDVQSKEESAFTNEDVNTLSILADQIAVAIENTRLFDSTQRSYERAETAYRQYVKGEWTRFSRDEKLAGYRYTNGDSLPLDAPLDLGEADQVVRAGNIHQSKAGANGEPAKLAVPVKLRGEVIGVLHISSSKISSWTDDDMDIVESISERIALAIENARLFHSSVNRAARERIVSDISSRISGNIRVKNILQMAAQELSQALNGPDVLIQLRPPEPTAEVEK